MTDQAPPDKVQLPDVNGTAALAIVESLMLALNDRDVLPEREIMGVLHDAITAHENELTAKGGDAPLSKEVVVLIKKIIASGNSVRRK